MQRSAIVLSGWDWQGYGSPERLAIALAQAGWKVLYCSNPSSFLRHGAGRRSRLAENIERFEPRLVGQRLNFFAFGRKGQARLLVSQILAQAGKCGLSQPIVIYPHGNWVVEVAKQFRARGIFSVFLCMDHLAEDEGDALTEAAHLALVIPQSMYIRMKEKFPKKLRQIPQFGPAWTDPESWPHAGAVPARLAEIPRPRLAYLGSPVWRLKAAWLQEIFSSRPDWHFLACGPVPETPLPNVHDIGWVDPGKLPAILRAIDVGFMPYDCDREFNRGCVPLKVFDYFSAGIPVVSTSLVNLSEFGNLIYFGDTAEQLKMAVEKALAEAPEDPRKQARRQVAREHSIAEMAKLLSALLTEARAEFAAHLAPAPNLGIRESSAT